MKKLTLSLLLFFSQAYAFMPKSFSTNYTQEYKSKLSRKIKKSHGKFDYKYPGNIKFTQSRPSELVVTSNKKKTWIYTPPFDKGDQGQVTIGSGGDSLSKFFDLLTSGIKSNKGFEAIESKNSTSLVPNKELAKELGIKNVEFIFKGKKSFSLIDKIKLTYTDKRVVTLILNEINTKTKFNKDYFTFSIPENTKITHQ